MPRRAALCKPHGGRHVQKAALVGSRQSAAVSLDEAPDAYRLYSFRLAMTKEGDSMSTIAPAEQDLFPTLEGESRRRDHAGRAATMGPDCNLRPPAQRSDGRRNDHRAADHGF